MNPQNSSELPPVYTVMPEQQQTPEQQPVIAPEQVAERVRAQAVEQTAPIAQPVQPLQPTAVPAVSIQGAMPGGVTAPAIADDIDLIEKEWVEKAKAIVERTKDDPHQQEREISRYKADYVKKRFNVDLKLEDTA